MITAQEAKENMMRYLDCSNKFKEYEEYIDKKIRKASKNGDNNCIVMVKENKLSDRITAYIGNILVENEYTVRMFKRGFDYGLWISW